MDFIEFIGPAYKTGKTINFRKPPHWSQLTATEIKAKQQEYEKIFESFSKIRLTNTEFWSGYQWPSTTQSTSTRRIVMKISQIAVDDLAGKLKFTRMADGLAIMVVTVLVQLCNGLKTVTAIPGSPFASQSFLESDVIRVFYFAANTLIGQSQEITKSWGGDDQAAQQVALTYCNQAFDSGKGLALALRIDPTSVNNAPDNGLFSTQSKAVPGQISKY